MKVNELSEQALIKACKKNERLAQKQLYQRYYVIMMRVCHRYVSNSADAVDVLNQGFFKAFTKIDQFDEDKGKFKNWLIGIMIKTAIDHYRKYAKQEQNVELNHAENTQYVDGIINNISANEILELVQSLSPQYKMVFNLIAIEGYTHKEVSKLLNISIGTSKSNLFKAKAKLKQMIVDANQFTTLKEAK